MSYKQREYERKIYKEIIIKKGKYNEKEKKYIS